MKPKGPVLTLLVGLAAAAVLLGLSMNAKARNAAGNNAAGQNVAASSTAPAATAPASPTASGKSAVVEPARPVQATYAGRVTGGGASVAIAVHDGHAVAYLCDGRRIEAWLQGTAAAGQLSLTGSGQASLTGSYGNGLATGTLVKADRRWTFRVPVATAPSGLYRATARIRNAKIVAGWIVLPGGAQVGILSTDETPAPAPPLDLSTRRATLAGTPVTAKPIDGGTADGITP